MGFLDKFRKKPRVTPGGSPIYRYETPEEPGWRPPESVGAYAEAVSYTHLYQEASVILNQANQMGYTPTFFGVDGMDGILTLSGFDIHAEEGGSIAHLIGLEMCIRDSG